MLEANVLYSVTGVVVVGLVSWVAVVLKTAKEPWARPVPKAVVHASADVPLETPEENAMTNEGDPITAEVEAEAREKVEAEAEAKEEANAEANEEAEKARPVGKE